HRAGHLQRQQPPVRPRRNAHPLSSDNGRFQLKIPRTLHAVVFATAALSAGAPALRAQTSAAGESAGYQTFVIGDENAHTPDPVSGGLLLSGGGHWNYEAFRWFTAHAGHGHIVVLRASGTTESQDEFY